MALLHAADFEGAARWSATSFAQMIKAPGAFVVEAPEAFLLGRVTADEAELLTLVVAVPRRRNGTGRALIGRFDTEARTRGATDAFLEVASDNAPALVLYARTGWTRAGRRPGYYAGTDALILRKSL